MSPRKQAEPAEFFLTEEDVYRGDAPYFFEPGQYPWAKILEDNWRIVYDEFLPFITGKEEIRLSSPNPPYLSQPGVWKNIYFYNFLWKYHQNCRRFPKTYALLKSVPNLTFAEVTVLEPHAQILPHIGETNTTIRGHLGLVIPASLPVAGMKVGTEERSWQEGKVTLFSDAHRHAVWNHSNQRRFVLVFDVVKDEYAGKKLWYCAQALSTLVIKGMDEKLPVFKKLPRKMLYGIHLVISAMWYIYLPIQQRIPFL